MRTILVVEDDLDLRRMFRTALSIGGYRVLEAGDGLDALRTLEASDVDALVLDLDLPLVSGQVVLQELTARAVTHQVPIVIVVTGLAGPHDKLKATCVLIKPVTSEQLIATVQRCLATGSRARGV